jgi:hypothetical protein
VVHYCIYTIKISKSLPGAGWGLQIVYCRLQNEGNKEGRLALAFSPGVVYSTALLQRRVAQLGLERCVRDAEVGGSNPLSPILLSAIRTYRAKFPIIHEQGPHRNKFAPRDGSGIGYGGRRIISANPRPWEPGG